jgi:hypothetical protein
MRHKILFNYRNFFNLLVLSFLFYSCDAEQEFLHGKLQSQRSSRMLTGKEATEVALLLKSKLNATTPIKPVTELSRNNGIEIDYTKILEVIDSVGIKNYTFLIKNHPEDDNKTFHNLIMNVKPTNELEVYLYKYMLTEVFALAYNQGLATMAQLRGKVNPKDFLLNIPCPEEELISIFNPANPSDNDDGNDVGGIGMPGDGGTGGEVGGDDTGGDCLTFSVSWVCSCGASAATLEDLRDEGHAIPVNGVNYTATMVLTLSYSLTCRVASNPCTGDGDFGVIPPEMDDPCAQLKKLSQKLSFTSKMNILKYNVPNGTVEKGFRLNEMEGNENSPIIEGTANGVNYQFDQIQTNEELYKTYGTAHNHNANNPKHIGVFTPEDLGPLLGLGINEQLPDNPWRSDVPKKAIIFVTTNRGLFALKINDITKLQAFWNDYLLWDQLKSVEFFYQKFHHKDKYNILPTSSHDEQVKGFLRFMQDYDIGVDLYEGNQSNYLNWRKLNLVNNGNNNFSFTETPCNL